MMKDVQLFRVTKVINNLQIFFFFVLKFISNYNSLMKLMKTLPSNNFFYIWADLPESELEKIFYVLYLAAIFFLYFV